MFALFLAYISLHCGSNVSVKFTKLCVQKDLILKSTKMLISDCFSFYISDPTKVIHTEMMLVPEEFENYQIGVDTDVTFCLKELRVIK